jgi:hypothetical protein
LIFPEIIYHLQCSQAGGGQDAKIIDKTSKAADREGTSGESNEMYLVSGLVVETEEVVRVLYVSMDT